MKRDDSRIQDLHALCREAGEQAAGWGIGPGLDMNSGRSAAAARSQRRLPLKVAVVSGLSGLSVLALAVVAAQFRGEPAASAAALLPPTAATRGPAQTLSTPLAGTPHELVRRQGSALLSKDVDQVPLPQLPAQPESGQPGSDTTPAVPTHEERMSQPDGSC